MAIILLLCLISVSFFANKQKSNSIFTFEISPSPPPPPPKKKSCMKPWWVKSCMKPWWVLLSWYFNIWCACACMYSMCMYVWWLCGVVVVSLAQGLRSTSSSPTQAIFHLVFHLPPTSPPSCDWVPGICWGANARPFLMKQQWSRWDFGCPHHLLWGKVCSPASS